MVMVRMVTTYEIRGRVISTDYHYNSDQVVHYPVTDGAVLKVGFEACRFPKVW